jgi:hypothetical protein
MKNLSSNKYIPILLGICLLLVLMSPCAPSIRSITGIHQIGPMTIVLIVILLLGVVPFYYDPREDLTSNEVAQVMDNIISKNIFMTSVGELNGKLGAIITTRQTEELEIL